MKTFVENKINSQGVPSDLSRTQTVNKLREIYTFGREFASASDNWVLWDQMNRHHIFR
jgi:hypothetical protein